MSFGGRHDIKTNNTTPTVHHDLNNNEEIKVPEKVSTRDGRSVQKYKSKQHMQKADIKDGTIPWDIKIGARKIAKSDCKSYYTSYHLKTRIRHKDHFDVKSAVAHFNRDMINNHWTQRIIHEEFQKLCSDIIDCFQNEVARHQNSSSRIQNHNRNTFNNDMHEFTEALESLKFIINLSDQHEHVVDKLLNKIRYFELYPERTGEEYLSAEGQKKKKQAKENSLEELKKEMCQLAQPKDLIAIHTRGSSTPIIEKDTHRDPAIIWHSRFTVNNLENDKLNSPNAVKQLISTANSESWDKETLKKEGTALIIDIAKACKEAMMWHEDIFQKDTETTTIGDATISINHLQKIMKHNGIAIPQGLKETIQYLTEPEVMVDKEEGEYIEQAKKEEKDSKKLGRRIENIRTHAKWREKTLNSISNKTDSKRFMKSFMIHKANDKMNELKQKYGFKENIMGNSVLNAPLETRHYYKDLQKIAGNLSGYPEDRTDILYAMAGDIAVEFLRAYRDHIDQTVSTKFDDIVYFAETITTEEPETIGELSDTGRHSGLIKKRNSFEKVVLAPVADFFLSPFTDEPSDLNYDKKILTPEEKRRKQKDDRIRSMEKELLKRTPPRGDSIRVLADTLGGR